MTVLLGSVQELCCGSAAVIILFAVQHVVPVDPTHRSLQQWGPSRVGP